MNFLKTLFWIVLTVLVVVFSINNWQSVTVNLWSNLQADIKLPLLILLSFFAGLVPALIWYRTKAWRATRRLGSVERELEDVRGFKRYTPPAPPASASATVASAESELGAPRIGAEPAR